MAFSTLSGVRKMSSVVSQASKIMNVFVEGNIASGKTSFLSFFENHPNVKTFSEPVERWRNVRGFNVFDYMYKDPERFGLTFQTYVQLTMLDAHTNFDNVKPGDTKLMERSIFSAKHVFVENLHRSYKMTDIEYVVLSEWFDWIISKFDLNADLIIYLRTKPEVVHERLLKRSRSEEKQIPLAYCERLHELHENWLIKKEFPVPGKVLVIDANDDETTMKDKYEKLADSLLIAKGSLDVPSQGKVNC